MTSDMVSDYGKLVPNFYDKTEYVLHIRNLQLHIVKNALYKNPPHTRIHAVSMDEAFH